LIEQLETHVMLNGAAAHTAAGPELAIDYLALSPPPEDDSGGNWRSWYEFLPWEDWRRHRPDVLTRWLDPAMAAWCSADDVADTVEQSTRRDRVQMAFGADEAHWDEERVLERFNVLADAGLVERFANPCAPHHTLQWPEVPMEATGTPMAPGHRRSLARAIGRLRTRVKSSPVVFDLVPERFTLFELQLAVEAILGPHLHKQNFRRLVEHMGLVEPAEGVNTRTGGRPAKLFRFRPQVLIERRHPGVRVRAG
jgi:hypothetical protein